MKTKKFLPSNKVSLVACMSLFAAFTGCVAEPSGYRGGVEVEADFQDDYDYYPEYETYYSYHRHEFVYLDGGVWVRRREPPRGISVNVILAAPSVRLDFHDAPERHHSTVIRSYPRTWRRPDTDHAVRQERPDNPPERHDFRPEQRPEVRTEPRETTQKYPAVQPAPTAEPKPEPRATKPKPQKKKVAPKEQHPDNKPEENKDDHKDDRKDDKHDDDNRGPKR